MQFVSINWLLAFLAPYLTPSCSCNEQKQMVSQSVLLRRDVVSVSTSTTPSRGGLETRDPRSRPSIEGFGLGIGPSRLEQ